jgi:hypothetical protein
MDRLARAILLLTLAATVAVDAVCGAWLLIDARSLLDLGGVAHGAGMEVLLPPLGCTLLGVAALSALSIYWTLAGRPEGPTLAAVLGAMLVAVGASQALAAGRLDALALDALRGALMFGSALWIRREIGGRSPKQTRRARPRPDDRRVRV